MIQAMRAFLALAVAALVTGATAAAQPPQRIVFAADRNPERTGEIYSFDLATGVTRDISRSLATDTGPAVSPDGRRIAFGSMRSGKPALYVARIDGSDLQLVKRFDGDQPWLTAYWSPDGSVLAATGNGELWIGPPGAAGRVRWGAGRATPGWSRDGRYFAYVAQGPSEGAQAFLTVLDPAGRMVVRRAVDGSQLRDLGWSADDRLAWVAGGTVRLLTTDGARLHGRPAEDVAWSPDGRTLAVERRHAVELLRGGVGTAHTIYRDAAHRLGGGFSWLGSQHLVVATDAIDDNVLRIDTRTGSAAPAAFQDLFSVVSPDQRLVATVNWWTHGYRQLRVGPLLGASGRVIAQTRDCPDDHGQPYDSQQFVPGTKLVVYLADCGDPTADLYAVGANGSGLRQLTWTAAHEQSPVPSPDGRQIAYVRSPSIGHACEGCPSGLWVMNADGTHARRLTFPVVKGGTGDWDADPSWSPDGTSIVFDRSTINGNWHLMVIGAPGGTPRVLPIPGARKPKWGPRRIAYTGALGAVWTALPDGSDRRLVASRHTCDNGCFYAWTPRGLAVATVVHSTLVIRGAGPARRIHLPFRPQSVAWAGDGRTLFVSAPGFPPMAPGTEGDLYRVDPNGTLTRLTVGLGAISLG
jgi:Tol biopolymer transport system component